MGTALVTANVDGLKAIGYEPHPFFADIARAKTGTRDLSLVDSVQSVLSGVRPVPDISSVWGPKALAFLAQLVDEQSLAFLAGARVAEDSCPDNAKKLYRLVVSRMLEGATGAKTDGIYKAPATPKRSVDIQQTLAKVLDEIRSDLASVTGSQGRSPTSQRPLGESQLYAHTAEAMHETADESVDICVTSPPYLNNFDFAEMARMELYFWNYAGSWAEITDSVRSRLIINTTTAPAADRRRQDHWAAKVPGEIRPKLLDVRESLAAQRRAGARKKEYDTLVLPYFAQMNTVMREVCRVLKPGAPLHLVVSDAALYGVHIRTEQLLAQLMILNGLNVKDVIRLRHRGGRWVLEKRQGAADGLGEFHVVAVKGGEG